MKRKDRKQKAGKGSEVPSESENAKLQREIDETIADMEAGVERLRKKFRKMQEQLGDLHKHIYPDPENDQSEEIVWNPDSAGNALMA